MTGALDVNDPREAGLGDRTVYDVLDLCLECRACKTECPVGVDMARFKSEFLSNYWDRHGTPLRTRILGHIHDLSAAAHRFSNMLNPLLNQTWFRTLNEYLLGIDHRRSLPKWAPLTLSDQWVDELQTAAQTTPDVMLFRDTFTQYYDPEIGLAATDVLRSAGFTVHLGPDVCCGRPLISQGLLTEARERAEETVRRLLPVATAGQPIILLEPSCLSSLVDDIPSLLRGETQQQAQTVAQSCVLFEDFVEQSLQNGQSSLTLTPGPLEIVLHGHCHQKSLGLVQSAKSLLDRIPDAHVTELDSGCCGMAGSFGYTKKHFDVSQQIGERRLLPAARALHENSVLVAAGTSCRHQVHDFTGVDAVHPAVLLRSLLG
jgi:Fe-S oxidoreductase